MNDLNTTDLVGKKFGKLTVIKLMLKERIEIEDIGYVDVIVARK